MDGWSDLDTLVIVRDEVFQSVERLERFKKYFSRAAFVCYQIDPLAHHELVAVSVYDIAHYPQTLFPMPVFQNAAVLTGAADVPFALRDDAAERMLVLREFRSRFMEKVSKNTYSTTAIDWKNDLACALLLPALALQAKGEFVYKRESFTLAKERFPDLDWSCIDEASAIRRDWRAHSLMQRTPVLWVLQGLIPRSLFKKLLFPVCHRQPRQSPEDIARLTRAFLELSDAILEMA
ncbi:hypothetical protein COU76_01965 [Candidatus Peregrinibacteria bacterium CG10_big_fil_rev_8_21_14_0_10_49_10]|nr:MAG: hypothetical protein COU76_01965 [Candidatus Peregrinibacteria bacterium CG10_big_fil_rev_8_21_14_0_10_49_10]